MKNIAVLVKQVPDTETKIQIAGDSLGVDLKAAKWILNPYDEFAIEEAIKLAEKTGAMSTVISMGPDQCQDGIRTALAMGIQKAIHIDTQGQWYDAFATASALVAVLKEGGFDFILCGKQAIDGDNAQVAQMVAELLDIPHVMIVEKIEVDGDKVQITRRIDGGSKELYSPTLPALVGAEKGLNTPRYASLPGIMKAKSKPIDKKLAKDLLAGAQSLTRLTHYVLPPERLAGKKLEGDVGVQVQQLVKLLHEEAKVI